MAFTMKNGLVATVAVVLVGGAALWTFAGSGARADGNALQTEGDARADDSTDARSAKKDTSSAAGEKPIVLKVEHFDVVVEHLDTKIGEDIGSYLDVALSLTASSVQATMLGVGVALPHVPVVDDLGEQSELHEAASVPEADARVTSRDISGPSARLRSLAEQQ